MFLKLFVLAQAVLSRAVRDPEPDREAGQTTAEYALVLVGVAAIALLVVAWAPGSRGAHRTVGAEVPGEAYPGAI